MSQDAKKEEFKKYLEKAGVLELLTKSLVSLYEEPEKPGDAVNYLKKTVGGTDNDKQEIEKLQTENTELKAKVWVAMSLTIKGCVRVSVCPCLCNTICVSTQLFHWLSELNI